MALETKLSHTAAIILQAIEAGYVYGFSVMETTGLPSGTVYPALRRLERDGLIRSYWESQAVADAGSGPVGNTTESPVPARPPWRLRRSDTRC